MSKLILTNVRYFVSSADLTGAANKIELTDAVEEKEVTNFNSNGAKEVVGGLETVTIAAEGQWEATDLSKVDDAMWANRRVIEAHTFGPNNSAAVSSLAYVTQALRTSSKLLGAVDDVAPWALSATGSWPLARGAFLLSPGSPITTTGTGTAVQLTAVPAGQYLYASLHVLSITSTPTLTLKVQSDDNAGMSSPVDVASFTAATALGGQIWRVAGPITDNYFRVNYTITGGSSPSILAVVAVGIA